MVPHRAVNFCPDGDAPTTPTASTHDVPARPTSFHQIERIIIAKYLILCYILTTRRTNAIIVLGPSAASNFIGGEND